MGNVPAKESGPRSRSSSLASDSTLGPFASAANRRSSSFASASSLGFSPASNALKKKKEKKEKQKHKIDHMLNLIVRYTENVDGGYLAPYGNYKSGLNYKTSIVRDLIIERKLAPFFTPLEDYDESMTNEELLDLINSSTLHAPIRKEDLEEEEEDPDDHKLQQTVHAMKRKQNKLFKLELKEKAKQAQEEAENKYKKDKSLQSNGTKNFDQIPSNDLLLRLYRNSEECPICFLFYPSIFNYTRCCEQPICTECFVQMKRLDPHLPHDEGDTPAAPTSEEDISDPSDLISESVKCPFCAVSDFGVTYTPPNFRTGINGKPPSSFRDNVSIIEEECEEEIENNPAGISIPINDLSSDKVLSSRSSMDVKNGNGNSVGKQYHSMSYAISKSHSSLGTPPKSSYSDLPSISKSSTVTSDNSYPYQSGSPSPNASTSTVTGRKRRGSLPPTAPGVVTIDDIRPDWEQKLLNARARIAKRSANATALHATSLITDPNHEGYVGNSSYASNGGGLILAGGRSRVHGSFLSRISRQDQNDLEQRMIEEALRLSLIDEEERKLKQKEKQKEEERKKNSSINV